MKARLPTLGEVPRPVEAETRHEPLSGVIVSLF